MRTREAMSRGFREVLRQKQRSGVSLGGMLSNSFGSGSICSALIAPFAAPDALEKDYEWLLQGGVFTLDVIAYRTKGIVRANLSRILWRTRSFFTPARFEGRAQSLAPPCRVSAA